MEQQNIEPRSFQVMAKPSGPLCNLDCTYCFYLEKEKLYPGTKNWGMPPSVLESYIRQYIESQQQEIVTFAWQGGEPTLLGIPWFENVLALQQRYSHGKRIENVLQTNGVTLNGDWADFFAANNFLIGISIDGPRELHDVYRIDKGQKPTFDLVLRGIEQLIAADVRFNTLTVVNRKNSHHPLDVYRFLKQIGSSFMPESRTPENFSGGNVTGTRRTEQKMPASPNQCQNGIPRRIPLILGPRSGILYFPIFQLWFGPLISAEER